MLVPELLPINTPHGASIYYHGPHVSIKTKACVIYFTLSGMASLYEDPFNNPTLHWIKEGIRVFSWDLPFHEPPYDPAESMQKWAMELRGGRNFIEIFMQLCKQNIDYLHHEGFLSGHIGVAGLSRGAFMAAHLAARDKRMKALLGFAPLTESPIDENQEIYQPYRLSTLTDRLLGTPIHFYIGNHDIRVGTEACYAFIKNLADRNFEKGSRSPPVELNIYPSIGFKGHGTPPHIFKDGAEWLTHQLIKENPL